MSQKFDLAAERLPMPKGLKHAAILRCCKAWYRALEAAAAEDRGVISCRIRANEAYRVAMPPLSSLENIRDFIACVTHGFLLGTVLDTVATRLLYAAQVAVATLKSPSTESKGSKGSKNQASIESVAGNDAPLPGLSLPGPETPVAEGDRPTPHPLSDCETGTRAA